MKKISLLIIALLLVGKIFAQPSESNKKDTASIEKQFVKFLDSLNIAKQPLEGDSIMLEAYRSLYVHQVGHQKRAFDWQYNSSIIIFWVVISILFSGLALSIVQFVLSYKNLNLKIDTATEMKLSPTELSVKSSVLGIIILVISIVFFYLYLTIVYPISFVK